MPFQSSAIFAKKDCPSSPSYCRPMNNPPPPQHFVYIDQQQGEGESAGGRGESAKITTPLIHKWKCHSVRTTIFYIGCSRKFAKAYLFQNMLDVSQIQRYPNFRCPNFRTIKGRMLHIWTIQWWYKQCHFVCHKWNSCNFGDQEDFPGIQNNCNCVKLIPELFFKVSRLSV